MDKKLIANSEIQRWFREIILAIESEPRQEG